MAEFQSKIDITSSGLYGMDITNGERSSKVASDLNGKMQNIQKYLQNGLPEEVDILPNTLPEGKIIIYQGKIYIGDTSNIPTADYYTKAETLANNTKTLFGLDASAVPDAVFNKIKTLIDSANNNANGKAKIQTGSYVGTGTGGDSNPTVINLNFTPKFIVIAGSHSSNDYIYTSFDINSEFGIWFEGVNSHKVSKYPEYANFNVSGNTLKITGSSSSYQFNETGEKYVYFAIG